MFEIFSISRQVKTNNRLLKDLEKSQVQVESYIPEHYVPDEGSFVTQSLTRINPSLGIHNRDTSASEETT